MSASRPNEVDLGADGRHCRGRGVPDRPRSAVVRDRSPAGRPDRHRRRRGLGAAGRRPRAPRRRARPRQDAAGADRCGGHGSDLFARAVHARSHARRRHRDQPDRRRRRRAAVRVPEGADLRQRRAGRRDQPRDAQDAVGAARGDAGAVGHRRQDRPTRCRRRSSCSPRRTRSRWRGPIRCPRRSSIASCSSCASTSRARDELHAILDRTTGAPEEATRGGARARAPPRDARARPPGAGGAADPGLRRAPHRGDAPGALAAGRGQALRPLRQLAARRAGGDPGRQDRGAAGGPLRPLLRRRPAGGDPGAAPPRAAQLRRRGRRDHHRRVARRSCWPRCRSMP